MKYFFKTLAYKNNNPFNIRYNSSNRWKGLVSNSRGFCKFENLSFGVRAGFVLLNRYLSFGYKTPSKIIHRFSPYSEDDTERYLSNVCAWCGFKPDDVLSDRFSIIKLGCAMMFNECAYTPTPEILSFILDLFNDFSYEKENS